MKALFDRHFDSLVSLAIRALSVLAGFAVTFFIGHRLGPVANGQYALVTQTAMFLSIVAVGGIDMAVVREFSASVARGIALSRASFVRISLQSTGFAAAIIALLAIGGDRLLTLMGREAMPRGALAVLCVVLLSRTLTRIMSAVLRSQKRYILGQSVEVLMIPVIVVALLISGLVRSIDQVLWATAVAGLVVALVGVIASLRLTRNDASALSVPMRSILAVAVPLWGVAMALSFSEWYGLATVSAVLGVYQAGLYRVALQIGTVLAIVSMGLFSVYSAQISAAHHAGDRAAIARLGRSATRVSTLLATPAAIILFVLARPILGLIGPEFTSAATPLRVMLVGQLIYTITGPAGLVLALAGHQRVNLAITVLSTVSLIIVAPFAARWAGLTGISAYVAFILVMRNLASLYYVWRLQGINVMTGAITQTAPQLGATR